MWAHNNVQYVLQLSIFEKNVRMRLGMHWILRIILSLVIPFWNNYRIFSHPVHCLWELRKKNGIYAVQFIVTNNHEFWPPSTVLCTDIVYKFICLTISYSITLANYFWTQWVHYNYIMFYSRLITTSRSFYWDSWYNSKQSVVLWFNCIMHEV